MGAQQKDAELARVYKQVLAKAASDANATAKIRAMESAWVVYRDAYMDATYPAQDKQAAYGTVYPMQADLLRRDLTQTQITALNRLLHGDEPETP